MVVAWDLVYAFLIFCFIGGLAVWGVWRMLNEAGNDAE